MLYSIQQAAGVSDALIVIGTISVFAIAGVLYAKHLDKSRGKKMVTDKELHKMEWEYCQKHLADDITNSLEEMVNRGKIRRELAERLYARFAAQGFPDLLRQTGVTLKRSISLRLQLTDWTPVLNFKTDLVPYTAPKKEYGAALRRFQNPVAKANGEVTT